MIFIRKIKRFLSGCIITPIALIKIAMQYKIEENKKILVVSNALNEGGAPLVLWQVVKIMRDQGYSIFVISDKRGVLEKQNERNIYVFALERFHKISRKIIKSMKWEKVLVNTIVMYEWVNLFSASSVVWWIHEGFSYINEYKNKLPVALNRNVKVFCVSEWSQRCLENVGRKYHSEILYYGVDDSGIPHDESKESNPMTFLMIGALCKRKRQIDLLKAAASIKNENVRFLIVGSPTKGEEEYAEAFLNMLKKGLFPNIDYIPSLPHNELLELYSKVDMLVCCSDDDPLPVVVTEAFMNSTSVIISDCCGQAILVENGVNGYVYKAGDIDDLKRCILLALEQRKECIKMGKGARRIFENIFEKQHMKKRILEIL